MQLKYLSHFFITVGLLCPLHYFNLNVKQFLKKKIKQPTTVWSSYTTIELYQFIYLMLLGDPTRQ